MNIQRREFIKATGILGGAALGTFAIPKVHASENNMIKVALVGCGGRGGGAAMQALSTKGPVKLWAMADAFEDKVEGMFARLKEARPQRVQVSKSCRFWGFDSYKNAIDSLDPGDVVLLATPPVFRPYHLRYAVDKGIHVFMEKSFGVDAPGVRMTLEAGKKAIEKNLKIAAGLDKRHYKPTEETIRKIHDGNIGAIESCWVYRQHGPAGIAEPGNWTPLQHQLRNFNCFTWTCGGFFLDWMIHNIDICCWAMGDRWPVWCQGYGGRQVRTRNDQMFDHCSCEYRFDDGTPMMVFLRQIPGTWTGFRAVVHGSKGSAVLGEGVLEPKIYKNRILESRNVVWEPESKKHNQKQEEIDRLFKAIREDIPWNESDRAARACLAGIMGRMAVDSGQEIAYETAWNSEYRLCPEVEKMTWETPPPCLPDETGRYPTAMPGITREF